MHSFVRRAAGKIRRTLFPVKPQPAATIQDVVTWLEANPVNEFRGAKSKQPLVVEKIGRKARFVRLSLQVTSSFHLDTIEIYNKDGRNIAPDKKTIISSCYNDDDKYNGEGALIGKKNGGNGFHTKREKNPWLVIDLGTIRNLDKVVIYNREDQFYTRALSLRIECSQNLRDWGLVHDNWKPLKTFDNTRLTEHTKALLHVAVLDAEPATAYINKLKKSGDISAALAFQQEVNELLAPKELALGPHGLTQTFNMRSDAAKDKVVRELSWLLSVFNDKLGIAAFISSGTLLGVVRDGQLIPHDDDVDICYISNETTEQGILAEREAMVRALTEEGCRVAPSGIAHYWCTTPGGQAIDLFTGYVQQNECFMNPIGSVSKADVLPLQDKFFHGHNLKLPANPEPLLQLNYGPNWRYPDPLWTFDWSKAKQQFKFLYF
ncbi:discoidin domain-containing protein [Salinimonas lutimaris]|uniref:discoidin domain-containing protein n=1 Tax=Salinimonas lutimaris TaxID=914153 RepID=UPI0010C0E765|nr:discoidin domain-containing protein [Salinimonas lutimaris]